MRTVSTAVRLLTLAAVLLLATVSWSAEIIGTVVGVADGDTITVLTSGKEQVRVRIYGIDAPETRQPFGTVSKKGLSDRVFRKEVRVEVLDTDRYGRTVGRVFLGEADVGLDQVRAGLAWWYARFAANDEALHEAEAEAHQAKRGLWADEEPTPPWEWRGSSGKRK